MPMNRELFGMPGTGRPSNPQQVSSAPATAIVFDNNIATIGQRVRGLGIDISDAGIQKLILKNGGAAITVMQKNDDELRQWAKDNMVLAIANAINEQSRGIVSVMLVGCYINESCSDLGVVFQNVECDNREGLMNWYRRVIQQACRKTNYKATG